MIMMMVMVVMILVFFMVFIGMIVSKKNQFYFNNSTPFECGVNSVVVVMAPVSMRFFLLAVIFLIFDVELIFLFPVILEIFQFVSIWSIFHFFLFLMIVSWGLVWEWNQKLLNWSNFT